MKTGARQPGFANAHEIELQMGVPFTENLDAAKLDFVNLVGN